MFIHVIPSFRGGGAERFLLEFLQYRPDNSIVVVLRSEGVLRDRYHRLGIRILTLKEFCGMVRRESFEKKQVRLCLWLYKSILAGLLFYLLGFRDFIWFVRHAPIWDLSSTSVSIALTLLVPRAKLVVFNSNRAKITNPSWMRQRKVRVIPNGVSARFLEHKAVVRRPQRKVTIGFIGRSHPIKGISLLKQIVNQYHGDDVRFVLVGSGLQAEFESYSEFVEIHDYTFEIVRLMQQFDILLCCSISESCPNVVLQAIALGKTVISTDVGDVREWVDPAGLFSGVVGFEVALRRYREGGLLPSSYKIKSNTEVFDAILFELSSL